MASGECSKQVFDGGNLHAVAVAQRSAECGFHDVFDARFDFSVLSSFIGAAEYDPGVFGCRLQNNRNCVASVETGTATSDLAFERVLKIFAVFAIIGHMIFFLF